MITSIEIENKLSLAVNYYKNCNESLTRVSKKFNVSPTTLKTRLIQNNIQIRNSFKRNQSNLDKALLELTFNNILEISNKYNISFDILNLYLNKNKSEVKKYAIESAIKEYQSQNKFNRNINDLALKYGLNRKTIVKYLNDRNIEITNCNNGISVDEHVFDNIDTEEKAYWLGFMYADGYIYSKNHRIGLSLSIKDIDHLKKFNNFLKYDGGLNISETHQFGSKNNLNSKGEIMYMITTEIDNKNLWENLNNKGCIPNKSLQLTFPDTNIFNNDQKLILAFIRGYFDGDGTLGYYLHSKTCTNKEESLMFVGTKNFLQGIQNYLGLGFLMLKPNCNQLTYRLSYSTKKANNAAKLMYENATIYLTRKYNIYINDYAAKKLGKNGEG